VRKLFWSEGVCTRKGERKGEKGESSKDRRKVIKIVIYVEKS